MVIWIAGLSGSGKTTLAKIIRNKLEYKRIIHIDGDKIREMFNNDLGHSIKDRLINAERISKLVKFISEQNIDVIVSVLSNFPVWLEWNRKKIKDYFEVYLKTNLAILKKRRPNLYSGKIKNVVGLDIEFKEPKKADFVINNCKNLAELEIFAKKIIKKLKLSN